MLLPVTVTSSCFFVAPRNSRQPHQSGVLPCHTHPAAFNPVLVRIRHKDSFLCCSFRSPVSYSCRFVGCFDGVLPSGRCCAIFELDATFTSVVAAVLGGPTGSSLRRSSLHKPIRIILRFQPSQNPITLFVLP